VIEEVLIGRSMHRRLGFRSIRLEVPPRVQWEEVNCLFEEPTMLGDRAGRRDPSTTFVGSETVILPESHFGRERLSGLDPGKAALRSLLVEICEQSSS